MKHLEVLNNLVTFSKPTKDLAEELSKIDWDYTGQPMIVLAFHIKSVLQRFLGGEYDSDELENWANLIECREDLEFESTQKNIIENIIYSLANPVLEGEITVDLCKEFIKQIDKSGTE